jgi:hypothetical protein
LSPFFRMPRRPSLLFDKSDHRWWWGSTLVTTLSCSSQPRQIFPPPPCLLSLAATITGNCNYEDYNNLITEVLLWLESRVWKPCYCNHEDIQASLHRPLVRPVQSHHIIFVICSWNFILKLARWLVTRREKVNVCASRSYSRFCLTSYYC